MKKIISILLLVIFTITNIFAIPYAKSETAQELLIVNTDGVNVRSAPGTYNSVLFKLSKGTYVLNIGSGKDRDSALWYKIYDFNTNKSGYVASYLLDKTGVTIKGEDTKLTVKVNADYLNVRTGPGTQFNLVKRLNYGTKVSVVRIVKRSDGEVWYKFKDGNNYYFIASWYTVKVEETSNNEGNNNSNQGNNNNQGNSTNNQGNQGTTPQKQSINIAATSTDFVNLRAGPSTDYEKIILINKGDPITIIGFAKNHNGELWLQCTYNGKEGFAIGDYFKFDTTKVTLDLSTLGTDAKTNDNTNLRAGPQISYNALKVVPVNTSLKIAGVALNKEGETWFEVSFNNAYYWVRSDTLTTVKKEKGLIENVLWQISEQGIDIVINGKNLPKPNINILNGPIRAVLTYENTNLLNAPKQTDLNIYPFTRYVVEANNNNSTITIYLLTEIPYEFEEKSNTQLVHFKLPKVNEEIVEIGGSVIFTNIQKIENTTYISLDDFLNFFNTKIDGNNSVSFFGRTVEINKDDIKVINDEKFISVKSLQDYFDVSVTVTPNEIYIDPILLNFKKDSSGSIFTFSFPVKAKKTVLGNKDYLVLLADTSIEIPYKSTKRNNTTPPQIQIELSEGITYEGKDNVFILKEGEKPSTGILSNRIIVIDPGHGSYSGQYLDVGAIGYSGTKEAYIVLDIALRLKKLLESAGAKVILTHSTVDDPNNPTLKGRADLANSSGGDLFISIHLNSSVNNDASGTETYYWYDTSKRLADTIQNALVNELGTYNRGTKKDYLYVCREVTTMPAILTEIGFISNPKEEDLLKDPNFLEKVAQALFKGIVRYLNG